MLILIVMERDAQLANTTYIIDNHMTHIFLHSHAPLMDMTAAGGLDRCYGANM